MTAPELSADERARVAAFGIHDAEALTTPHPIEVEAEDANEATDA